MTKTDPRHRRERQAARRRATEAAQAQRRIERRRNLIGIGVVVGVILAVVLVVRAATGDQERRSAGPTTTAASTTSSAPAASLPTPPAGASVAGTPACPPVGGAPERVTRFEQAPPMCLAPGVDYEADIHTSVGTLTVDLYEKQSPEAVNAFVVLARYRYYEGLPFTSIRRGAYAEVADPPGEGDGAPPPGFRLPATGDREGNVLTSLLVGLAPERGTTGGALIVGLPGDDYTTIPPDTTPLGFIRDHRVDRSPGAPMDQRTVSQLINDAGSASGTPTEAITIDRVEINELAAP